MNKFVEDLEVLMARMCVDVDDGVRGGLDGLREKLVGLYERKLVKINHSVMELLCAKHLLLKGYAVDVEHPLEGDFVCDLYGSKGDGTLIVEVETGYTPPKHALDPATYNRARIASKIARYGLYSDKFSLGVPPYYILQMPPLFTKPPRYRESEEVGEVKVLCDEYYRRPPITINEIRNARLHTIYIIDVDRAAVREVDPEAYGESTSTIPFLG